ncbi:MAG: TetR/AcrR family transcriptional regulator [Gemmatimonadaceae bacterium]|nr:TetR/AcrR family transcriptional regulator [Gemmatimonadaceae bacterium]
MTDQNDPESIVSEPLDPPAPMAHIPAASLRAPRQERGQKRLDEILDAAEALVTEVGPAAASIQEIAQRAGASVGSIYHFFPNKDAIFAAIRARHDAEASEIAAHISTHATEWARLDLAEFVSRLISPFAEFLERKPAYLALAINAQGQRIPKNAAIGASMRASVLAALSLRWPESTEAERLIRVMVTDAIGDGISTAMVHAPAPMRQQLVDELIRAVYGYLSTFETKSL